MMLSPTGKNHFYFNPRQGCFIARMSPLIRVTKCPLVLSVNSLSFLLTVQLTETSNSYPNVNSKIPNG